MYIFQLCSPCIIQYGHFITIQRLTPFSNSLPSHFHFSAYRIRQHLYRLLFMRNFTYSFTQFQCYEIRTTLCYRLSASLALHFIVPTAAYASSARLPLCRTHECHLASAWLWSANSLSRFSAQPFNANAETELERTASLTDGTLHAHTLGWLGFRWAKCPFPLICSPNTLRPLFVGERQQKPAHIHTVSTGTPIEWALSCSWSRSLALFCVCC